MSANLAAQKGEELWGKKWDNFATDAIHAGQEPEKWNSRMVVPPITMSTTFKQDKPGVLAAGKYEYSRGGNPTRDCLEECLAAIECGSHGLAFSSGLAATNAIITSFLKTGDHIITSDDVYGGTNRLFQRVLGNMGITASFINLEDEAELEKAFKPNTKLVWIETPTNPTMKIIDIRTVTNIARAHNCLSVVDNTFMSAYFQRPILLGADMTFHSATKYMNGHSDVVMGLVITRNAEIHQKLYFTQFAVGAVPSPFDCYLCNRGLKTLHVRMERHFSNAKACAKMLLDHPKVEKINYPGDESHPRHHIVRKNCTGSSGMLAFWLKDATVEQAGKFLSSLKVFTLAESLGGFESLAEHPAIMTHASVPPEERKKLNIGDNFIRLSVGIEDEQALVDDLKQAIEKAYE
jgi:cystathionine gamma-lyase